MNTILVIKRVALFIAMLGITQGLLGTQHTAPILIQDKIAAAKKEIQECYKNLATEKYFEKMLMNDVSGSFDASKESELILRFVEELEQRNDEQSNQLLAKINNLFNLKFHQMLSSIDKKRGPQQAILAEQLKALYNHHVGPVFPFQTLLTKTMLQLAIISSTWMISHENRYESLLLVLEQAQESCNQINNALAANKIDEQIIKGLFEGLMRDALTPEESIFDGAGKKIVMATITVGSIVAVMVVGYYGLKWLMSHASNQANAVVDNAGVRFNGVVNNLDAVGQNQIEGRVNRVANYLSALNPFRRDPNNPRLDEDD